MYYVITKEQADIIGMFEYKRNFKFSPYVRPQKNGTYLLSERIFNELSNNPNLKKIEFKTQTTNTDDLLTKDTMPLTAIKNNESLNFLKSK